MNLRHYTIALLISAFPGWALANPAVSLEKGDFLAAEKVSRDGQTILSVKLSKSGKAKLKKLNQNSVGKTIHSEIGGVTMDATLRQPIGGDSLEMGPYSADEAQEVISEINGK